jgi:hypothetical protein
MSGRYSAELLVLPGHLAGPAADSAAPSAADQLAADQLAADPIGRGVLGTTKIW